MACIIFKAQSREEPVGFQGKYLNSFIHCFWLRRVCKAGQTLEQTDNQTLSLTIFKLFFCYFLTFLAWVGSLATGIMFFLGPLTTSLCERFGCRIVTICGGLICIAGLLLSSIVTSLIPLYFTYGVMFGSGTSLCYFPTIIVLSKYFKRRIAVVNGLVTAGSGVGTLVIGPVVQALFLRFGVANTFRIVAGIFSLILLCGATFRPVPAKYSQYNDRTNEGRARRLFDWTIFKNKGYVIWITSLATFQLGYFVPFVHLVRDLSFRYFGLDVLKAEACFPSRPQTYLDASGKCHLGKRY